MSFISYIENLREKPVEERQRVLLVSSVVSTLIIIAIWLTVANPFAINTVSADQTVEAVAGPFATMKEMVSKMSSGIKNGFTNVAPTNK